MYEAEIIKYELVFEVRVNTPIYFFKINSIIRAKSKCMNVIS